MEKIEQHDIDLLADILWWIKGYHAAFDDSEFTCSFKEGHVKSLEKILYTLKKSLMKGEKRRDE